MIFRGIATPEHEALAAAFTAKVFSGHRKCADRPAT